MNIEKSLKHSLLISRASESPDVETIVSVAANCGHPFSQYVLTTESVRSDINRGVSFFIVKKHGEPVAFISYQIDSSEKEAELVHLGVLTNYHKKGIGVWLYGKIEERISRSGVKQIYLWTQSDNKNSRNFWQSQGFKTSGFFSDHYPDGEEAVLYRKALP